LMKSAVRAETEAWRNTIRKNLKTEEYFHTRNL
jgi:hypothetical protein